MFSTTARLLTMRFTEINSNEHSKTMTRLDILNDSVKFLNKFKLNTYKPNGNVGGQIANTMRYWLRLLFIVELTRRFFM